MLLGRGVRVVRGWGILVLGDEGVRRSVERLEHIISRYNISLRIISSI